MSHIDTLKVYEEYRAAGFNDKQAKDLTNILENSFMTQIKEWLKDTKEDFASQRFVFAFGGLMVTAMLAMAGELWYISKEVSILSRDMQEVRTFIRTK